MKRFKTLTLIIFGIIATAMLGACSCSKSSSTIHVHQVTVAMGEYSGGVKEITDPDPSAPMSHYYKVVEGTEFTVGYEIKPAEATNTKVTFSSNNTNAVGIVGTNVTTGATGSGRFVAKPFIMGNNTATITVTADDGGYSGSLVIVVITDPDPLPQVTDLTYNSITGRVEWDAVTGASGYIVKVNGTEYVVGDNFYTGTGQGQQAFLPGERYEISVLAKGDTVYWKDAEEYSETIWINALATPVITSINNGLFAWSTVTGATEYDVVINNIVQSTQTATNLDLKSFYDCIDASRVMEVSVKATRTQDLDPTGYVFYINSANSEARRITWLAKPTNVAITSTAPSNSDTNNNSYITWTNTTSAAVANYKIVTATGNITSNTARYDVVDGLASGEYTITIQAMGDTTTTISDEEHSLETFTFKKLPAVAATVENSKVVIDWSSLRSDDPSSPFHMSEAEAKEFKYGLYFTQGVTLRKVVTLTDTLEYDLANNNDFAEGGAYSVYARIFANSNTEFASGSYAGTGTLFPFDKLKYVTVQAISRDGVLTIDTVDGMAVPSNAASYRVYLDGTLIEMTNNADNEDITINGATTSINLHTELAQWASLEVGNHTVKVVPNVTTKVAATESRCNTFPFTKLGTPTNNSQALAAATGTDPKQQISWGAVSTGSGYQLTVNSTHVETLSNASYKVPVDQLVEDTNTFEVVVLGNNLNTVNSDVFEFSFPRLNAVTGIKVENGGLSWNGVDGVTFQVWTYNSQSTTPTNRYPVNTNSYSGFDGTVGVTIHASKANYFDSVLSNRFQIVKLSKPTNIQLDKANLKLTFEGVSNASGYLFSINFGGVVTTYTLDDETFEVSLVDILDDNGAGDYTAFVYSIGDTDTTIADGTTAYVNSDNSTYYSFTKMGTPTITKTGGAVQWSIISSKTPATFELDFGGTIPNQIFNAYETRGNYSMSTYINGSNDEVELPAGDYTFTVVAHSVAANVLDSEVSEAETVRKYGKVVPVVNSGVISFANLNGTVEYQYSIDNNFSTITTTNNKAPYITIEPLTVGDTDNSKVVINSSVVKQGYLRFIVKAGDGLVTGSFGNSIYFEQLPTITTFAKGGLSPLTDQTLSWNSVTGATGYVVTNVTASQVITQTDSLTLTAVISDPTTAGKHTYSVYAVGSNFNAEQTASSSAVNPIWIDGEPKTLQVAVLAQVSGLNYSNGILTWNRYVIDGVDEPNYLKLTITDNHSDTYQFTLSKESTSFNLVETPVTPLPMGRSYTATLYYEGSGTYTIDSAPVNSATIVKHDNPTATVTEGQLRYNIVSDLSSANYLEIRRREVGASAYTVLTQGTDYTVQVGLGRINTIAMNFPKTNQQYELQFKTIAPSIALNSEYGGDITVVKYSTITDFNVHDRQFYWTPVANGQSYYIEETTDNTINVVSNSNNGYEAANIVSDEGVYYFHIKARGTQAYSAGSGVAYLDSEFSDAIMLSLIGQVHSISLSNGILSWENITGVSNYDVELRSGSNVLKTIRSANNTMALSNFSNELAAGDYNTFAVRAVTTTGDSYILTTTEVDNSVSIYYAPKITSLYVYEGRFAWTIDVTKFITYYYQNGGDISALSNIQTMIEDLASNNASNAEKQTYKPFYAFTLEVNGHPINLDPTTNRSYSRYEIEISGGAVTATFYYAIEEDVNANTQYHVKVRAQGNTATQDNPDNIPMVLASEYSEVFTATKTPCPQNTRILNGNLLFTLLNDAPTNRVKHYVISAQPLESGASAPRDKYLDVDDMGDIGTCSGDQCTYNLNPNSHSSDNWLLSKNVSYSIKLTSLGTSDSRVTLQENPNAIIYLRSSNYTPQTVKFLDDINTIYYNETDTLGGSLSWDNMTGIEQEIYFVEQNWFELNALDGGVQRDIADWLIPNIGTSKIINFVTEAAHNYLDFTQPIIDANGDSVTALVSGAYYVGVRLKGNGTNIIASENIGFTNNLFTILAQTSEYNLNSWLDDGKFRWTEVQNVYRYRVVLVKVTNLGEEKCDEVATSETTYEVPENVINATNQFKLYITPLGAGPAVGEPGMRYLSGYTSATNPYSALPVPVLEFDTEENYVEWANIVNANKYQVVLDGESSYPALNKYTFSDSLNTADHSLKVRAISENSQYLTGPYTAPYRIVRLADPVLWTHTTTNLSEVGYSFVRPGAVVTWKTETDTLNSGITELSVYSTDETGNIEEGTLKITERFNNNMLDVVRYYDISTRSGYPSGYYTFVVRYINDEASEVITLASKATQITVYKQDVPHLFNGDFYTQTQIDAGLRPTSFENYAQWTPVYNFRPNTNGNYVLFVTDDEGVTYREYNYITDASGVDIYYREYNELTDSALQKYSLYIEDRYVVKIFENITDTSPVYQCNSLDNPTLFEQVIQEVEYNDVTLYNLSTAKMYLNIGRITDNESFDYEHFYVKAACMGEELSQTTEVNPYVIGYLSSDYSSSLYIEVPLVAPEISSTPEELNMGIIKWTNYYQSDIEIMMIYERRDWDSVETQYGLILNEVLKVNATTGAIPTMYQLPIVSNNYQVKIRYVQSGYASEFSDVHNAQMRMFKSGGGTYEDPYIIFNGDYSSDNGRADLVGQLRNIVYYPNAYYKLQSNIAVPDPTGTSSYNWTVINVDFGGTLDGNGKSITNIAFNAINMNAIFRHITSDGTIKNLTIGLNTSISVNAVTTASLQLSTVTHTNDGTINNVTLTGNYTINVNGRHVRFGGYAYINNGTINNCTNKFAFTLITQNISELGGYSHTNNGTISAVIMKGSMKLDNRGTIMGVLGAVAYANNEDAVITLAKVEGTFASNSFGGVVYLNEGLVEASGFYGNLTITENNMFNIIVGGVVGENRNNGSITGSFATLTASTCLIYARANSGHSSFGGLVGYQDSITEDTYISNCYTDIDYTVVEGSQIANRGAVIGYNVDNNLGTIYPLFVTNVYYYYVGLDAVGTGPTYADMTSVPVGQTSVPTDLNTGLDEFRFVVNSQYNVYTAYGTQSTLDDYVGYAVYVVDHYVVVTDSNKDSLDIVVDSTVAYTFAATKDVKFVIQQI